MHDVDVLNGVECVAGESVYVATFGRGAISHYHLHEMRLATFITCSTLSLDTAYCDHASLVFVDRVIDEMNVFPGYHEGFCLCMMLMS